MHDECELWKSKYEELENRLKTMMYDKESTEEEYRQYIVNLKEQLENTNAEVEKNSVQIFRTVWVFCVFTYWWEIFMYTMQIKYQISASENDNLANKMRGVNFCTC